MADLDKLDASILNAVINSQRLGFPSDRESIINRFMDLGYTRDVIEPKYDALYPSGKNRLTMPKR